MADEHRRTDAEAEPAHGSQDGDASPEDDSIEILEVVGIDSSDSVAAGAESNPSTELEGDDLPPAGSGSGHGRGALSSRSREELCQLLLRKQADFDNARKRLEREQDEARGRIWGELLVQILPVLDNLDRALSQPAEAGAEGLREGVALTTQQLKEILEREGLEPIRAVGRPFDPHLHEAAEMQWVEGTPPGQVIEELLKGYRFQEQLLRPALVKVSGPPEKQESTEEDS